MICVSRRGWRIASRFVALLAVLTVCRDVIVAQEIGSTVSIQLTNDLGRSFSVPADVQFHIEGQRGDLSEVAVEDGRIPFGRYHVVAIGGVGLIERRAIVVNEPSTDLWLTIESVGRPFGALHGATVLGRLDGDGPAGSEVWVKLLSVPGFEELADRKVANDSSFRFRGLGSGVYLLVAVSRPLVAGAISRVLGTQEVLVCSPEETLEVKIPLASVPETIQGVCPR